MRTTVFGPMLCVASVGLCQTPAKEPDTLQSLLVEIQQLRQDIGAMAVASLVQGAPAKAAQAVPVLAPFDQTRELRASTGIDSSVRL